MREIAELRVKYLLAVSIAKTIWIENSLAGCGAIKELDAFHAEIKSMHVALEYRNQGVAKILLRHIIEEAKNRKYRKLSLETGSMAFFEPARQLYLKFGFVYCAPFASYKADPNSVFMTKDL
jgi:putative acetyltransferase